nr:hypothetical protein [Tanacetum cinerariifolium]
MLHICPRVHGQSFNEPALKEEILAFIYFLGHSTAIKMLTYVNINKLYQPWRSFADIINKCLTGKSSGYNSLRLSQAQILWGLYHKRNVDYTYLMWEHFVYQVKHKNQKKSNEMYYPRFTKSIINHFMSKDHSIPKRNKVNWHYVRDDHMNSKAYKEYYAIATGEAAPKPKANVRRTRSSCDTSITPPTAATSPRLTASTKGKQTAKASKAKSLSALSEVAMTEAQQLKLVTKRSMQQTHISQPSGSSVDEGTGFKPGVHDVPTEESEDEFSWNSTDDEGDDNEENDDDGDEEDEGDDDDANQEVVRDDNKNDEEEGGDDEHEFEEDESDEEIRDEESFDPIPQTPKNSKDEGNGEEDLGLNGRGIHVTLDVEDSHVTLTPVNPDGQQESSLVSSQFVTSMLNLTLDVGMESIFETTSQLDVQTPTSVALLPMTAPTMTPSTIATITTTSQAPILPTTVPSNIIQNLPNFCSLFRFNDRLRSLEANFSKAMQMNQFAGAVSVIPRIVHRYMEQRMNKAVKVVVNEQLEAEVLTQSSHSSRTSYAVAAALFKMELKKILIEKMEGNKSIQHSDEKGNLYKALVDAYESDKIILETYGETNVPAVYGSIQPWISELAKQADTRSSFNELMDTPLDFSNFIINQLKVDTLTPELLADPAYELMKGSCKSLIELEYHLEEVFKATTDQLDWVNPEGQQYPHNLLKPLPLIPNNRGHHVIQFEHFINNDLEYLRGGASSRKYTTSITKTKAADYRHIKWIGDLFYGFTVNRECTRDVYSKRRIIAIIELKIVEWHSYKHLDWIMMRRDDDKLYKFKEDNFKRLRIQDIEDMLMIIVQGKLTNLTVEEHFAFNVSLQMFTRSIVIQRRVKDLQLRVKSYQKKLNLAKLDSYRSDLKRKEAYTSYSNLRGFIYQNKDKRNRLMRIDELHKFKDRTLTDVRIRETTINLEEK